MAIIGYIVLAWFIGMGAADISKGPEQKKVHPEWGNTCRPWCQMSGSLKNAARSAVPWPFRKGRHYECPSDGDRDDCTGEVYTNGKWIPGVKPKPWSEPSAWQREAIKKVNRCHDLHPIIDENFRKCLEAK